MIHRIRKSDLDLRDAYSFQPHNERWKKSADSYKPRYRYELKGVISHIGEALVGHYIAMIKFVYQNGENYWILYSGDNMSNVSEQKVLSSQPYQLIYERIDTFKHSVVYDKLNFTIETLLKPFKF